ncbi:unnamed protein product [Ceutorhynchus assimilis]|uniref:C2H2-type domain-containing protein n=1 Tax=Ceutorhynchus assimilis TaxID=467358 RepID=A0A9N9MHE6_9CUCU|nr:unnamed protein product [Ceutorhynchus assimilis]
MELESFGCFKCSKTFLCHKSLIKHISLNYPYLDKYKCVQKNCHRSFSNINTLRKHYAMSHNNNTIFVQTQPTTEQKKTDHEVSLSENVPSISTHVESTVDSEGPNLENEVIKFIAKLYSNPTLNKSVVQEVIGDTKELIFSILNSISEKILHHSESSNILLQEVRALDEIFSKIKSDYLRLKYFENSDTLFRSEPFYIGSRWVLDNISKPGAPGIKINTDFGQKCSLELKLKKFLELPKVNNEILNYIIEETSQKTITTSIIQGRLWKNIQNSFEGKVIFPLLLFYDEIGAVYVSLACLPPEYTSLQENVFLYQLFYTSDKQFYGNGKLFSSLINELKKLESQGIDLFINNEKKKVYFPLLLILGDNLGLNSILGFSESFNSDYFCRICVTHRNFTKTETDVSKLILRTTDNYQLHAGELSYGVKEKCIWNDLVSLHVTRNRYCDLMHDVFEGVLRYDMASHI